MPKTWYEVVVSSKVHGSGAIETFEHLGNAKAFAVAMCENPDMLLDRAIAEGVLYSESADVIESVFIDRWAEGTWDGEGRPLINVAIWGELDETFPELKYYPQREVKDG